MSDTPHEQIREMLLPYALGELGPSDRARVRTALDADPELRDELAMLEAVGARLVSGVELTPAPAALRARVMDAVRPGAERASTPTASAAPTSLDTARSRRRFRFAMPAVAGALAAACLLLAVVAVNLNSDLDATRDRVADLRAKAGQRGGPPPGFEDAKPYPVSTKDGFAQATGSLIRVSDDKWILMFNDVPSPGVGKSWQVWTRDSNGLIENVGQWSSGSTQLIVLDRADIQEVMVSFEPTTRPAPVPSSEPVADVQV